MILQIDEKFSLIALNRGNIRGDLPDVIQLPGNYFSARHLPGKPDSHWREWIGSFTSERLEEAELYIGAKLKSKTPSILDGENETLNTRTSSFYWALFLAGWCRFHDQPIQFTGVMQTDGLNVRSLSPMSQPYFTPGTPLLPQIDTARLIETANLATAIDQIYQTKAYDRFKRVFNAFTLAINTRFIDVRLHQFVRCIEGFILPEIGKTKRQFVSKTILFIGNSFQDLIGELFDLRSQTEHLHNIYNIIPGKLIYDKYVYLCRRAFEAEGIARYCISTLLQNSALWPHFESDLKLSAFWSISPADQQKVWGAQLDLATLSATFEAQFVERLPDNEY